MYVLLVDDDADNRSCLSDFLHDLGHQVTACENGFTALERLEEDLPDVVLTDLRMPGMNGFELAETIRRRFSGHEIEVIIFTGGTEMATEDFSPSDAVQACLTKPLNLDQLVRVLGGIIERIEAASDQRKGPDPESR